MSEKILFSCKVNGEPVNWEIEAHKSLLRVLRDHYVYDVKCGCEEGDCGTCSVLIDGVATKSCITLAASCNGREVWTCKGLGYHDKLVRRLQDAFVECGSVQCGFCTPGMIMAATDMVRRHPEGLDEKTVRTELEGNICRCTGYHNIVKAILAASDRMSRGEAVAAA